MSRSLKKGPFIDQKLVEKIKKMSPNSKEAIKTWARACTIVPEMIGFTFAVHNGKNFITVKVAEEIVGHKLGEFAPTTKFSKHGGRMQREIETKVVGSETAKIEAVKSGENKAASSPK